MKKEDMEKQAAQFVAESRRNVVSLEEAIAPELAGARIFDSPVWGYGDAKDPMFQELKKKEAVGPQFLLPEEWLPKANSVMSFFSLLQKKSGAVIVLRDRSRPLCGCTPG